MFKPGFDNDKYVRLQSEQIRQRISQFGGRLYLEFGGKLFDDNHASRVLPGFQPDSKIRMLMELKDEAEIIIVINADAIEQNKVRGDLGITYGQETLRLVDAFRGKGLYVGGIVINFYDERPGVRAFRRYLEELGLKVYRHYYIPGYPSDIETIVSEDGYGRNEYIETTRSLVVVTAPGPGSGKMATCLSQLYHDHKHGISSGYAKFETFPIWNLPLKHPVNLAYEAATADLNDLNMIDPFHLEAYGKTAVNYNRDVEIFPVLSAMFKRVGSEALYRSPTDMGVNMAGFCIFDEEAVCEASRQEIIRRWYAAACSHRKGLSDGAEAEKIRLIMNNAGITTAQRATTLAAMEKAEISGEPAAALQLPDGRIATGRTSDLLGAVSAALLNALKMLGGIDPDVHLISRRVIEPVQDLKLQHLGNHNPRMHTDELLVALSICAVDDPNAEIAMQQLENLKGSQMHSTVILSQVDEDTLKHLGISLTCEPAYETKALFHK